MKMIVQHFSIKFINYDTIIAKIIGKLYFVNIFHICFVLEMYCASCLGMSRFTQQPYNFMKRTDFIEHPDLLYCELPYQVCSEICLLYKCHEPRDNKNYNF